MKRELGDKSDVSFAITADSGELETQAELLIRSIREVYSSAPIVVFIPESSVAEMNEDSLKYFRSSASVVLGEIPIPEYPISALIRAFVEAERSFDTEYLVALDTDTLVFDRLQISADGDVWLRPADVGAQYWTTGEARGDWRALYQYFGYKTPNPFLQQRASVDHRPIPPYWNSGVVVTTDRSLPSRWLKYTRDLYYEDELPVSTTEFFIDQISLALAVYSNNVGELCERENFPLGGRALIQRHVAVLHYGDRRHLARVVHPTYRSKLRRIGAIPSVHLSDYLYSLLVLLSTKSGLILSYRHKQIVRQFSSWLLPKSVTK